MLFLFTGLYGSPRENKGEFKIMFVIKIIINDEISFFIRERQGLGFFTKHLKDAKKFDREDLAKFVASAYDGAEVLEVEEIGGVLK